MNECIERERDVSIDSLINVFSSIITTDYYCLKPADREMMAHLERQYDI